MKSKLEFLKDQEVHQVYIGGIVYEMVKISQAEIAMENYTKQKLQQHGVMQGLPDSEIYRWLQSKNYQYSYDETQEYRMLFELDFPKIIREFVAEHQGSPTVGKAGENASVSDGK